MDRKSMIRVAVIVGVISLLSGGCSQEYNGAWGFGLPADEIAKQQQARAAAEKAKTDAEAKASRDAKSAAEAQAASPGAAQADASRTTVGPAREAQFETPGQADNVLGADRSADAAEAVARPASDTTSGTTDPAVRPLSLFGITGGNTGAEGRASQFDGPDNVRRVTFAAQGADFDPSVDPTGQWIVYASTQHRKTSNLYLKRVDGTTVTQLTNDPGNDVMPAFSPNGRRVAFASDRSGNWDIYMMDVTGGQPVQLTNDATDDVHPSFSPDGKQIVYCSHGGQSGQWELVVIDVDNPATKRFIGYGLLPSWSPVENKILFQRAQERGTRWFSIWTIDFVNGEGVRPTQIAASTNAAAITPTWSPDGKHIAFCTVLDPASGGSVKPTQADIWIVAADGTGRSNLTRNQFANLQPIWAKDGSIYFVSNRSKNGTDNIYALRPDRAMQVAEQRSTPATPVAPVSAAPAMETKPNAAVEPRAEAAPAANEATSAPAKETALVPER